MLIHVYVLVFATKHAESRNSWSLGGGVETLRRRHYIHYRRSMAGTAPGAASSVFTVVEHDRALQ